MRAIMVMFDSLRLDLLPNYGGSILNMPNFKRLAEHTVSFDNSYVGSLPCMPARRELHTGRLNFLHRSWGPLEPFDDSMPELLQQHGIHTHLTTDHYHYLEDGGGTYHQRYSTWECFRGQESDKWKASLEKQETEFSEYLMSGDKLFPRLRKKRAKTSHQNAVNRRWMENEENYPQTLTFDNGIDFIQRNAVYDNWFVQIETFDPHEPFTSPEGYQARWFDPDKPFIPDWPPYAQVSESEEMIDGMRKKYFALAEFCDMHLGRVLDEMDKLNLWEDTMLIVNTDHGFLLSEHGWWGKMTMPDYNEVCHTPLYIWDPRSRICGEHRSSLVQTIDLAPTILDFFGVDIPADMMGKPLSGVIAHDEAVRKYALFGYHGCPIDITDGRYVYMRAVADLSAPVYEYGLMPTHMAERFTPEELQKATLAEPFSFTKGCPVLKIPAKPIRPDKMAAGQDMLFDLLNDPGQMNPIIDEAKKAEMLSAMAELFRENDAPEELYVRYDIPKAK